MRSEQVTIGGMPRPGKALLGAMGLLLFVWIAFAVAINHKDLDQRSFLLFAGNADAILRGQVWRLFTAGLIHHPIGNAGVNHIVMVLLGLYFLGAPLEERWGSKRFAMFLVGSTVFGFLTQLAAEALLPAVVGQDHWYGAIGAVEAIAVAWALSSRGQMVQLFFVLPVSTTGLLVFVIGASVLAVLARSNQFEGLVTPFGGMLAGYLFGAGSPPPARRLLLKLRYLWLAGRAAQYRRSRPDLRVIPGGEPGAPRPKSAADKRWLN
jgi:membrane associated rhomboid family serine protease